MPLTPLLSCGKIKWALALFFRSFSSIKLLTPKTQKGLIQGPFVFSWQLKQQNADELSATLCKKDSIKESLVKMSKEFGHFCCAKHHRLVNPLAYGNHSISST
jgi:hypothetical protein